MFPPTEIPVLYKDIPLLFQAAQGTSETSAKKYFHREGLQKKPSLMAIKKRIAQNYWGRADSHYNTFTH